MEYDLSKLNKEQLLPVLDTEGAILVTAGAGSGKTRLLTHRIAYLIDQKGVPPYNILAITFTNKAANEMAERVCQMTPEGKDVWISTFHSMCAKMLRRFANEIGYSSSFSIYTESEKDKLIADILKEKDSDADFKRAVSYHISNAKNLGLDADEYLAEYAYVTSIEDICDCYKQYMLSLKENNAMDFDDLLLNAKKVLCESSKAREYYQEKFKYIHVDEFQDTNAIQYELIKILAAKYRNVCAVGDEDQCIYGWRGADISNIRKYISDFNCRVYKLEQNYRSTKNIISLANKLIANNTSRIEKKLWTDNDEGIKPEYYAAKSDGEEADYVAQTIFGLRRKGYKLSDFAVLMRVNATSRPFEQRFLQYGIPHRIYGGFKFFDRKEVKDLLAYFRIIANPLDNEAITRVINFPKRGIGASTINKLSMRAIDTSRSLYDVIVNVENEGLGAAVQSKVAPFAAVIRNLNKYKGELELYELMSYLVRMLDLKTLYSEPNEENDARKANISELVASIKEYSSNNPGASVQDYMQSVSLWSDLDQEDGGDCVNIATAHSAKGLEFKVVFVVGMEEGLFPISRAKTKPEIEEERRLFYVAITRAMERLYITQARSRFMYGQTSPTAPSRFLAEIGLDIKPTPRRTLRSEESYDYDSDSSLDEMRSRAEKVNKFVSSANKPSRRATTEQLDFKEGDKIRHRKFGVGRIVSVSGTGISQSAIIEFDGYGKMNIALAYAPISKE